MMQAQRPMFPMNSNNQPNQNQPNSVNANPQDNTQKPSNTSQPNNPNQPPNGNMQPMPNMNMVPRYPFPYMRPPMMWGGYPGMGVNPQGLPHPQQPPQNTQPQNPPNPQPAPQPSGPTTANEVKVILQEALRVLEKHSPENPSSNNSSNKEDDLPSLKNEAELDYENEYSLEEENLKNIWSGFLTKNKKDRIGVDVYQIRGNISENFNTEFNLNVSHRTQYDEIMKRQMLGIVAISPQNVTQCEIFQDYINYFSEKQRVGVINFIKSPYILYLVPPCDFSRKFYQNPKKHLLGILVDARIEPKTYVDMTRLNLPPPVISLTEKKLLSKLQKKNQS